MLYNSFWLYNTEVCFERQEKYCFWTQSRKKFVKKRQTFLIFPVVFEFWHCTKWSDKMSSNSKESFDDVKFMKELVHLRDTQEAIQSLSAWCIKNKKSAYKIARCWVKVTKKGKNFSKINLMVAKFSLETNFWNYVFILNWMFSPFLDMEVLTPSGLHNKICKFSRRWRHNFRGCVLRKKMSRIW